MGVNRLFLNQRHFHIFNPFCPPPGSPSRDVLFLTCLHSKYVKVKKCLSELPDEVTRIYMSVNKCILVPLLAV